MSTVRGNRDHKSTAEECTIPSTSRSQNNPGEEPAPETNRADASRAGPIQWKHRGNSACPAFLSPAARWEGAWLCCSAGFCILTGGRDRPNQTSLWGHCAVRRLKNRSLCGKRMNANCLKSSLPIQLLQCGRRKSYHDNYSSAKRTFGRTTGSQRTFSTGRLLYLCFSQHKNTTNPRSPISRASLKSNMTIAKVATVELAVLAAFWALLFPLLQVLRAHRTCPLLCWAQFSPHTTLVGE